MPIINNEVANLKWQQKNFSYIRGLQDLISKKIKSITIEKDSTIVEVEEDMKFYWKNNKTFNLLTLMSTGDWEKNETHIVKKLIRKGDIVFDVGANFGWYTILFSDLVGRYGEVHSFEPFDENFLELKENIYLNNRKNTIINNEALSNYTGESELYFPKGSGGMLASLNKLPDITQEFIDYKCKTNTINNYMLRNNIEQIDFIKLDVEGAELQVLKAAKAIFNQGKKPIILVECVEKFSECFGDTLKDLHEYLGEYKYNFYSFDYDKDMYIKIENFDNLPDYNVICVPLNAEENALFKEKII